mmetsp:Transcript_93492/g.264706  ORF Transcript_93492/g.264706 Transcript_93492/m.264706 type:complete len:360 (-) Transcript_93492:1362-2441(-)
MRRAGGARAQLNSVARHEPSYSIGCVSRKDSTTLLTSSCTLPPFSRSSPRNWITAASSTLVRDTLLYSKRRACSSVFFETSMLLVAIRSTEQSQKRLMICVLRTWRSGSTRATKMYCFTLSKMPSHSSESSSSNWSGRLARRTSMCSSSKWSRGEASSCMARVFATSRWGHKVLTHFSSYILLVLPITYVRRPTALSPASASCGRRSRWRSAGGCSRSTLMKLGSSVGYSERRCTSADSPTCSTFLEPLTTKSRLMTPRRPSTVASISMAFSSSGWSPSSSSPPWASRRPSSESLLSRWAQRTMSCACTSHHSSLASAPKLGMSATMLWCWDEQVVIVERIDIPATRIFGCGLCIATSA